MARFRLLSQSLGSSTTLLGSVDEALLLLPLLLLLLLLPLLEAKSFCWLWQVTAMLGESSGAPSGVVPRP